jgi:hypothetical protein
MNKKRYEEIGTNYRYFLSWRHASFAGDLIVIYGVLSLTFATYKETPSLAWIVPALACPIGLLFLIIDIRTRVLYHAAIRAGKALEEPDGGFFTELTKVALPPGSSAFKKPTQSAAVDLLFIGSSLFLAALAVVLFLKVH